LTPITALSTPSGKKIQAMAGGRISGINAGKTTTKTAEKKILAAEGEMP
jgi:hypothetical protein